MVRISVSELIKLPAAERAELAMALWNTEVCGGEPVGRHGERSGR